ncbi:TetR family transcriptional regulator [Frondihabitans sp. PhB188]|uniref:TetR/AcrR family transcriptional regulator n=1 Tax=Frondihabitans sp. PhB188 TaxID=2485200 RepID=UPI000F4909D6|nr:TetR/AcrR family transcriptional regulator [Frondihabitans sp. PhB188]ROQ40787.1 TetR family transcriptional regulator [Frondihabitans sp. PhB188]
MSTRPAKVGRPRAVSDAAPETSARDQILTAAAALFVDQGFGQTSTRAIAEAVGIRQASLYYHFAGKDEILVELLETSVRPSVDVAERFAADVGDDATRAAATLFALAHVDVGTLSSTPHNIGTLYLLPEVQDARYDEFRGERDRLQGVYGRLGALASPLAIPEPLIGSLLIQMVEVVIQLRRQGVAPESIDRRAIATSCLRMLGLGDDDVRAAASTGALLLPRP